MRALGATWVMEAALLKVAAQVVGDRPAVEREDVEIGAHARLCVIATAGAERIDRLVEPKESGRRPREVGLRGRMRRAELSVAQRPAVARVPVALAGAPPPSIIKEARAAPAPARRLVTIACDPALHAPELVEAVAGVRQIRLARPMVKGPVAGRRRRWRGRRRRRRRRGRRPGRGRWRRRRGQQPHVPIAVAIALGEDDRGARVADDRLMRADHHAVAAIEGQAPREASIQLRRAEPRIVGLVIAIATELGGIIGLSAHRICSVLRPAVVPSRVIPRQRWQRR